MLVLKSMLILNEELSGRGVSFTARRAFHLGFVFQRKLDLNVDIFISHLDIITTCINAIMDKLLLHEYILMYRLCQ